MKWVADNRVQKALLGAVGLLVAVEILLLRPAGLENPRQTGVRTIRREELRQLILPPGQPLAPGIPEDKVPDYNLTEFHFMASKAAVRQWKIIADRAHLYNEENLVHAAVIQAYLYGDPAPAAPLTPGQAAAPKKTVSATGEAGVTVITAAEAKYYTSERSLELFGQVRAVFPDGFTLMSEYLHYDPETRLITVPTTYVVHGEGAPEDGRAVSFVSRGLNYPMQTQVVELLQSVEFTMDRQQNTGTSAPGVAESTQIFSDHCLIHRAENRALFTMAPRRAIQEAFVHVTQPKLKLQARRVTLNTSGLSRKLQYMIGEEDVAIKEEGEAGTPVRYATAGRADFDTKANRIFLTQLPQVYQDSDTITGEVVTIHRDTDIVEVEQSNAFSQGQQSQEEDGPGAPPGKSGP